VSPRNIRCAVLALIVVAGCVSAVPAGAAPAVRPGVPTGVRVASATPRSITFSANTDPHTKQYIVYVSLKMSDVNYANLNKPSKTRHQASSTKPSVTVGRLGYTTAVYYYRMAAKNSSGFAVSKVAEAHVSPPKPSNLALQTPGGNKSGLAITWGTQNALGFQIEQAEDRTFSKGRKIYTLHGLGTEFTPYGLSKGTGYYLRVRATNGASKSPYSSPQFGVFNGNELPIRVLTYNVLHKMFDGTKESGNTIAPWSKRLPGIVSLIKGAKPDVMSINEASDYVVEGKRRSIDSIKAKLQGYALAKTEPFPKPQNPRTGNYILYKTSKFTAVGTPGYWTISSKNWVAYQILQSKATRAQFLMISVHLSHGPNSVDQKRGAETRTLLSQAHDFDQNHGNIPIVYAGDFNSFTGTDPSNLDTPEQLLRAEHVGDSLVSAQKRTNTQYGSVNEYKRVASKTGRIIDHVFGEAGVSFRNWTQLLKLKHGKFVGVIPSDHNPVVADISIAY
jgi:endonuclease/exonuclease/phosphatase family metal-dependent hydrolase